MVPRENISSTIRFAIVQGGYRRIDCAPVYFNEDAIGDTLFEILNPNSNHSIHESPTKRQQNIQRSDLYVVSKLPSPFHRNVEMAVRKTLNDLRLDYLDLYLGTCCILKRVLISLKLERT
jgi:glycerol 2-dehydrogenase (NADP+)